MVRHMDPAAGELPDQPGVNGAEEQLPSLCPLSGPGHVIQQPPDLGAGKVGVRHQAGFPADGIGMAVGHQLVNNIGGAAALPHDGVGDGFPGFLIPDHRGLPLVGDADGGDTVRSHIQLGHGGTGDLQGGIPDLLRVMLHPTGLGENLPELLLHGGADVARLVKQDTSAAGRALI